MLKGSLHLISFAIVSVVFVALASGSVSAQTRIADSVTENFTPPRIVNFACSDDVTDTSDGNIANLAGYCPLSSVSPAYAITYTFDNPNQDQLYQGIRIWANAGNIYTDGELQGFDITVNFLDSSGNPASFTANDVNFGDTISPTNPITVTMASLGGPALVAGISSFTISDLTGTTPEFAFREIQLVAEPVEIGLVKTSSIDDGGDGVVDVGDTINYEYVVTNTGMATVFNVAVDETLGTFTGTGTLPNPTFLSGGADYDSGAGTPTDIRDGETVTFSASYAITQADINAGMVTNQAIANGSDFLGGAIDDVSGSANDNDDPTVTPILLQRDFSDAPSSYGVASHNIASNIRLGSLIDGDPGDLASPNADGDGADDDGVSAFPPLFSGSTSYQIPAANVTAVGTGTLHAWVDFDGNGMFEADEYTTVQVTNGILSGDLQWTAIDISASSLTYARLRFTSDGSVNQNTPFGATVNDGEVEDYQLSAPTVPVTLNLVRSTQDSEKFTVNWESNNEVGHVGYQLYALLGREWTLLNPNMILSDGSGPAIKLRQYEFSSDAQDIKWFSLVDVSLTEQLTVHGPYQTGRQYGAESPAEKSFWWQDLNLDAVNQDDRLRAIKRRLKRTVRNQSGGNKPLFKEVSLFNLLVNEAGIHRISHETLLNQGVDLTGLRHSRLSLTRNGEVVPVRTRGQNKSLPGGRALFGTGAYIEFYAEVDDNLYTDKQAYTLRYEGKRQNFKRLKARVDLRAAAATTYQHTLSIEENRFYDMLVPSDTDPWHFGQVFSFSTADKPTTLIKFSLPDLVGNVAEIETQTYGLRDLSVVGNDHGYAIEVNQVNVGEREFDGVILDRLTAQDVSVNESDNQLQLIISGREETPFDVLALEQVNVTYPRQTKAIDDYFEGEFSEGQVKVTGFTSNKIDVYHRDGNGDVTKLSGIRRKDGQVVFNTLNIPGNYIAVANPGLKVPVLAPLADTSDLLEGGAEYLIIAHTSLMGAELDELVALREKQYSVKVVDVHDIYGLFGNHLPDSGAIKKYIDYATDNLDTKFVVLVGSDTYDYKQYTTDSVSLIPTRYVTTSSGSLTFHHTPSDAAYGDRNSDGVPDLPVGRLAVRTKSELGTVVEKIQDYEARQDYAGQVLIVVDEEDAGNNVSFADNVDDLLAALPDKWASSVTDDYLVNPDSDGVSEARSKLFSAIDSGVSVTAYLGHSSTRQWSRTTPPLLTSSDVITMTNFDKPTVVVQWGCWNTYFVDPSGTSLGDELLSSGNIGAATVLGASTLTSYESERMLAIELNKTLYQEDLTIGEAVNQAKYALSKKVHGASDVLLGWQIVGDPALVINRAHVLQ